MLRSRANALVSVRRVTEVNAGRKTAGVDGRIVLARLGEGRDGRLAPARRGRVEAPARQAGVHPEGRRETARARDSRDRRQGASGPDGRPRWNPSGRPGSSPESYGFRPGRGCQDAIAGHLRDRTRQDLQARCGRWTPTWPPRSTGSITLTSSASSAPSPPGDWSRQWLKAGVIEEGRFAPTERGSPQGGVISPVLMNVALHGMEEAAGVRYITTGSNAGTARPGSPGAGQVRRRRCSPCVTRVSRPSRSRRGWPRGWRPGAWPSTRTRPASSTSMRGWTSWGSTSAATAASC